MRDRHPKHPPDRDRAEHKSQRADHVAIFGIHAVEAALANANRRIRKLYLTDNASRRPKPTKRQLTHERVLPRDPTAAGR
jgi:23S rRNA (guanosine2251-2'-O)-methyltransferase